MLCAVRGLRSKEKRGFFIPQACEMGSVLGDRRLSD